MTREEMDFIGGMNMCDEISNEAYKKIMCHCEEQEPCEDAIRRRDALDALHMCLATNSYDEDVTGDSYICYEEAEYEIENLQSVTPQPKTGWIPVSERLPETDVEVLVTDGVDMFVAWYSRKGMWQRWMSSDNNFERNTPIEAWMPLPEPYKAERSGEDADSD